MSYPGKRSRGDDGGMIQTWPVAPYERAGQPKLYRDIIGDGGGTDRQYNLMLANRKIAVSGDEHPVEFQWDLSMAPKPTDGRTHKAMWCVEETIIHAGNNIFTGGDTFLMCLDAPSPNSFSATNFDGGTVFPAMVATKQRPNSYYAYYKSTGGNGSTFKMSDMSSNITSFVGIYPVPTLTFSLRTNALPCTVITAGDDKAAEVELSLRIVLLD